MANGKQDGSNLINLEYTTGVCSTMCECCFVNFGDKGLARCKDILRQKGAYDYAMREGKRSGLYKPAPKVPREIPTPPRHERLLGEITEHGQGLKDIPLRTPPWGVQQKAATKKISQPLESWVEHTALEQVGSPPSRKAARAAWQQRRLAVRRAAQRKLEHFPVFLRVSTMSDSFRAPADWLRAVREAWGDHCFFNSSINTVQWAANHVRQKRCFNEVHKLVMTVNPGRQKVQPFRPAISRPMDKDASTLAMLQWRAEVQRRGHPVGDFVSGRGKPGGFLDPVSFPEVEGRIKFYRLRALPTIWPVFETDRPVVITMLRFKGILHILDWCRAYGFNAAVRVGSNYFDSDEMNRAREAFPDVQITKWGKRKTGKQARVWSAKGDDRNACPDAGADTVYDFEGSWYRPGPVDGFDALPYVCDRARDSCKMCGLCASLDGTQEQNTNWLNVMPWGDVWPPVPGPEGARYLGELNPGQGGDFFRDLGQIYGAPSGLESLGSPEAYRLNPQAGPMHPDDALEALAWVAAYYSDDQSEDEGYFCEGWDTHEDAATLRDRAVWSLTIGAADFDAWLKQLSEAVDLVALEGCDLMGIWDGTADCLGQFEE